MNALAVIPARFASTRFPGKPLAPLLGRPLIAWVVEAALSAKRIERVLVATDDARIAEAAGQAGAEVRMTRADQPTGTDRVWEAVQGVDADVVLNLQGDEPSLRADSIDRLAEAFEDPKLEMATLAVRGTTEEERNDPNVVKIVVNRRGEALYFSRAPIPYRATERGVRALREGDRELEALRHVGTYGFRRGALERFVSEKRRGLEVLEDLEQLRALALGWRIRVIEIEDSPVCVDVPADLAKAEAVLRARAEGVLP
jgi:3-deoxy-manno-octulosonate cytidylyltransferase (CMP-KDO synthetase)